MEVGGGSRVRSGFAAFKIFRTNQYHHPYLYQSPTRPPLTAIDKFLSGQSHFSHQQPLNLSSYDKGTNLVIGSSLYVLSQSSHGSIAMDPWPITMQNRSHFEGAKKASPATLIKGQWTDEEDRYFIFVLSV